MTDVAVTPEQGQEQAQANGRSKRNTAPIQITVPLDLKAVIKAKADEAGKTEARWVLENIAGDLAYVLPEAPTRGGGRTPALFPKGLTPDQKRQRFDAARTLLAALDKGEIDLDAIKAKLGLNTQPVSA